MAKRFIPQTTTRSLDSSMDGGAAERAHIAMFAPKQTLKELENSFLKAIEYGRMETVLACIEQGVNANVTDFLGRSALELSVVHEHIAIVEYLLPSSTMYQMENALLIAVNNNNVRICEMILSQPLYKRNKKMMGEQTFTYKNAGDENFSFTPDLTPLMLAAQKNSYYIVQLLIANGSTIAVPHQYFCRCVDCTNQREYDSVKYSKTRLNTYKALTSPAYLSLSMSDPIISAFQLSRQLDELATIEKEYKNEYLKLSEACRVYAVEIFELCRTTDEVMQVLNGDQAEQVDKDGMKIHSLSTLKLALKCQQKKFIAHPSSQRQLVLLWYSGVPWVRFLKSHYAVLLAPLTALLLPIMSLMYIIYPTRKLSTVLKTPFVKFCNHSCTYLVFAVLLLVDNSLGGADIWTAVACGNRSTTALALPLLIFVYILGFFWEEVNTLWRGGFREYLSYWWNWMDTVMLIMYTAAYLLRFYVFGRLGGFTTDTTNECYMIESNCDPITCNLNYFTSNNQSSCDVINRDIPTGEYLEPSLMANILYGLACMMSFGRIASVLPTSEQLGPLMVSFGLMIQDVLRALVVMILIYLSLMIGITIIYQSYSCENIYFTSLSSTAKSLFWATFNVAQTDTPDLKRRYAVTGETKRKSINNELNMQTTEALGYILFALYILANAVMLINMLIAMMTITFEEVYEEKDVEWKFVRAKTWMSFFESETTIPPPFNLIPSWSYIALVVNNFRSRHDNRRLDSHRNNADNSKKSVTNLLVKRYIHKKHFTEAKEDNPDALLNDIIRDIGSQQRRVFDTLTVYSTILKQIKCTDILQMKADLDLLKERTKIFVCNELCLRDLSDVA